MIQQIHEVKHWYEAQGAWPGLTGLSPLISAFAVLIAIVGAVWGDWLKTRYGWSGRTKLELSWGTESPFQSHGWINDVSKVVTCGWTAKSGKDRVGLTFYKLQARNVGHTPARLVSMWVKTIEHLDEKHRPKPLDNMISLVGRTSGVSRRTWPARRSSPATRR